jgi:hypothetical protein
VWGKVSFGENFILGKVMWGIAFEEKSFGEKLFGEKLFGEKLFGEKLFGEPTSNRCGCT